MAFIEKRVPLNRGVYKYVQNGDTLVGEGYNEGGCGKFKAASAGVKTSFTVNGKSYSVKLAEETSVELVLGAWYFFMLDEEAKTINFNSGGAALNFKVVGGTTQPTNPKENTIWINSATAVSGYTIGSSQPGGVSAGHVWIYTNNEGTVTVPVTKKNVVYATLDTCKQWNGSSWVTVAGKVYQNGDWTEIAKNPVTFWFNDYSRSGYTGLDGTITGVLTPQSNSSDRFSISGNTLTSNTHQTLTIQLSYYLIAGNGDWNNDPNTLKYVRLVKNNIGDKNITGEQTSYASTSPVSGRASYTFTLNKNDKIYFDFAYSGKSGRNWGLSMSITNISMVSKLI